jgi:hypothetical protein
MPDEVYSIVVDYVTKNGKLPTITMPPQVIFATGGQGAGASSVGSTIATAVVTSLIGGLVGAFAKTRVLTKIPKKKLGVQNATVFKNAEQITVDRRIQAQKKQLRTDLKTSAMKNEALTNKNRELAIKNEKTQEKLRETETMKEMERQENIQMRRDRDALQKQVDMNEAYSKMRTEAQSNEILQKSLQREQMRAMQEQNRKLKVPLTTEEKFSQVNPRSMAEAPAPQTRQSQVAQYLQTPKTMSDVKADLKVPEIPKPLFNRPQRSMTPAENKALNRKPYDNEDGNRRINKQSSLQEVTQ